MTQQHVYHATVVARLTYAASAWRGLARTSDLQRINSVIDRARRHGYCPDDLPSFDELCGAADSLIHSAKLSEPQSRPACTASTTIHRITEL